MVALIGDYTKKFTTRQQSLVVTEIMFSLKNQPVRDICVMAFVVEHKKEYAQCFVIGRRCHSTSSGNAGMGPGLSREKAGHVTVFV